MIRSLLAAALCAAVLLICSPPAHAEGTRAMRFNARTRAAARAWQATVRAKMYACMMGGKKPDRVPLDAKVLRREEHPEGGYALEEMTIQTLPDRRVHAWMAVPLHRSRRVAAILALHGHGGVGEEIVRGKSLYWYGKALAEMGYVVISPDIGQHELQHPSWSLMGERTWDALRCVDYLETRPEVDTKRMAVCGLSLGGETTMYVAALDERLKAVDAAGWLTTVGNMKNGHCPCWNWSGLEENLDFADIFSCIAPRPLVCEIGQRERAPGGFPVAIAQGAFDEVKQAYRVFGAEANAMFDVHGYGHVLVGRSFWQPLERAIGTEWPWRKLAGTADLERRGEIARRCFARSLGVYDGWMALRDPATGLYPRRTDQPVWAPQDNAADMYPFLFLTAHFVAPERKAELLEVMRIEEKLTTREAGLPDWYSIKDRDWLYKPPNLARLIFGAAEYCKDGLVPMTEVMGEGAWTGRMARLLDAIFAKAVIPSDFGLLPADDTEVNGDLLQALCRFYGQTRDEKYYAWAKTIADAYCKEVITLNGGLPAYRWDWVKHAVVKDELGLNDHANELVGGLAEFYAAAKTRHPEQAEAYRAPIAQMFTKLLDKARNPDGFWYDRLKASTGEPIEKSVPDTWGYALSACAAFGQITGDQTFIDAAHKALRVIDQPAYLDWPGGADSFADSIEGGLYLLNRFPEPAGFRWMERELPIFLAKQQDDGKEKGIIEGWYGDGNSSRTWLMAALYYTQGAYALPWRGDLRYAADQRDGVLTVQLTAEKPWEGKLHFDTPRHKLHVGLAINYPRLNEFPEWFTVESDAIYTVNLGGTPHALSGRELAAGLPVELKAGKPMTLTVSRLP